VTRIFAQHSIDTGPPQQLAMSRFNTKFTLLMSYAITSGERICGRQNLQAIRSHDLIKPASFSVQRVLGNGDLWITECVVMTTYKEPVAHGVSIMKFRKPGLKHRPLTPFLP
jgi:hypothetical protein